MKSWRTTLGGMLGVAAIAMKHVPQTEAWSDAVAALSLAILGITARDNKVSSEQAGAK